MTMRKILAMIIALAMVLGGIICLSGCSSNEVVEFELAEESEIGGLRAISRQENFIEGYVLDQYVLYDPDTLVMYVIISKNRALTMSVLYNADGTPKLYNPENN